MATKRSSAEIEIDAPARIPFGIVTSDITEADGSPTDAVEHHPLTRGPALPGFRWTQTVVHDRVRCHVDWMVTRREDPTLFEQAADHQCMATGQEATGRERWTFDELDGGRTTRVKLTVWQSQSVLDTPPGWLFRVGLGAVGRQSLRRRLAYLQYESEKRVLGRPPA